MNKKVFIAGFVTIAIIGAAILIPGGSDSFNANIFGEGKTKILRENKDVFSRAKALFDNASKKAGEAAAKSLGTVKNLATSKALEATKSASESIVNEIKHATLSILRGAEEKLDGETNLETNTIEVIPPEGLTPPPISYIAKLGSTTSFNIRKSSLPEFATFNLSIDWGDGVKEEKQNLSNSETQTILHAWNTLGIYDFRLKVSAGNVAKTYTGSVTVTR